MLGGHIKENSRDYQAWLKQTINLVPMASMQKTDALLHMASQIEL